MNKNLRNYSKLDNLINSLDQCIRTLTSNSIGTNRSIKLDPEVEENLTPLSDTEKKHSAGLMRVNHAGEVSAQALYQGQALTARNLETKNIMQKSAIEENDHLIWCKNRLDELNSKKSILDPFWYIGSFIIGATAGLIGDKWSLGFLAQTENQVVQHLEHHLNILPKNDLKSRAILEQMKIDEAHHETTAMNYGAAELPFVVKKIMTGMSKVMTKTAYYV
jgi:3-demethoxyubiquinol 3-hydroxylase